MSVKRIQKNRGKEKESNKKTVDNENALDNLKHRFEIRSKAFEKIIKQLNKSTNQ